ncbi:MAG: DUF1571 domain-containing protein [Planctomycetota bacterium]|nr:DUF1571 domain-containing protein [Planctomycetota bacterium]
MTGKRMVCQVHGCSLLVVMLLGVTLVTAEDASKPRVGLKEPVLHVAKSTSPNFHPLDGALELARKGLDTVHTSIADYTCTLVKRERVGGTLGDHEYMLVKVRNRRMKDGKVAVPFSVYMYFVKPASVKGREVMYVEGANSDKMIAHEGGTAGKYLPTVWIKPSGAIAMRGNRYPITEVGIENLILKLIERGEQDKTRGLGNCEVTYHKDAKINGRTCTLMQIKHLHPAPNLDFHMAQIFIDDELQVPIRYAAFGFPSKEGEELPVIEEYTYLNLKLNVGLSDTDYDYASKKYAFQ